MIVPPKPPTSTEFQQPSQMESAANPLIGTFNTSEVRPQDQPRVGTSRPIIFAAPYAEPPGIPVGLNSLDIGRETYIRVDAFSSGVKADQLNIHIDSCGDTKLYSGACSWLEVPANDPDFQFGAYSTTEDHVWNKPQQHHTRLVIFPRAYTSPPKVVLWLSCLHMDNTKDWRVKTYATHITAAGFTLHLDTLENSILYIGKVWWVAYTATKPNISSGSFNTTDMRPREHPQRYNSGYIHFETNAFTTTPRVIVAFNSLDIGCKYNLRVGTGVSAVSTAGMMWHVNSWSDTILYSAGVSYIALC